MRRLFSRYGGSALIIGKGKASNELLPEDQSLDNMLDHYAQQPVENIFYLSSYRILPDFMGPVCPLPKGLAKVGELTHLFLDVLIQQDIYVTTRIYLGIHQYPNVYVFLIHTDERELRFYLNLESNKKVYDYVLTFFLRGIEDGKTALNDNPEQVEMMILILAIEMGLAHTTIEFTPSKTHLGKRISPNFDQRINQLLGADDPEAELVKILTTYKEQMLRRKV